jgi:hypothetical protein
MATGKRSAEERARAALDEAGQAARTRKRANQALVRAIIKASGAGVSQKQLARTTGLSRAAIRAVLDNDGPLPQVLRLATPFLISFCSLSQHAGIHIHGWGG